MEIGVFVGCFIAMILGAVLLLADRKQQQQETVRIQKMRGSDFYKSFGRDVKKLRGYAIDHVLLERDGVYFKGMRSSETLLVYRMEDEHFRYLNAQKLKTLTLLLSEDIPVLADHGKYRLHSYKTERPNGQKDRAWEYVATHRYKAYVMNTQASLLLDRDGEPRN